MRITKDNCIEVLATGKPFYRSEVCYVEICTPLKNGYISNDHGSNDHVSYVSLIECSLYYFFTDIDEAQAKARELFIEFVARLNEGVFKSNPILIQPSIAETPNPHGSDDFATPADCSHLNILS